MNKLSIFFVVLLFACSQSPSAKLGDADTDRTVVEVAISSGEPMATADLTIGGMSCQMMCGNMIKGALAKVPGVSKAEVDYTDGAETGHAKVTYDPAQVDDAQLVSAVQALADGQYTVSAIAVKKQVKHTSAKRQDREEEPSSSLLSEVPMPNLVGMLFGLVRI